MMRLVVRYGVERMHEIAWRTYQDRESAYRDVLDLARFSTLDIRELENHAWWRFNAVIELTHFLEDF